MEITKRNLVLTFGTPIQTEVNVVVKNPNTTLTPTQIKTAMDAIIASNAIGEASVVDSIVEAKYVIQQEDMVTLPA